MTTDDDDRFFLNAWLEAELALKRWAPSMARSDRGSERPDTLVRIRDAAKLAHDMHLLINSDSGRSAAHLYRLHHDDQSWASIDEPSGIRELGLKALIDFANDACGHCQEYRDVYFSWTLAPKLPLVGCTKAGGCRCAFKA